MKKIFALAVTLILLTAGMIMANNVGRNFLAREYGSVESYQLNLAWAEREAKAGRCGPEYNVRMVAKAVRTYFETHDQLPPSEASLIPLLPNRHGLVDRTGQIFPLGTLTRYTVEVDSLQVVGDQVVKTAPVVTSFMITSRESGHNLEYAMAGRFTQDGRLVIVPRNR